MVERKWCDQLYARSNRISFVGCIKWVFDVSAIFASGRLIKRQDHVIMGTHLTTSRLCTELDVTLTCVIMPRCRT